MPRAEIAWIGFGDAGEPPAPRDPARDQIWLRDGRTEVDDVIGLSLGSVATESDSFDRPDVAWIYFGSAAGLPRQESAPSPDLSTAPTPRPEATTPTAASPAAEKPSPAETPPPAAVAPKPTQLYLNEVGVLPLKGGSAFVELANAGTDPIPLSGVTLRNERGAVCRFPPGTVVPPSTLYLVFFDGAQGGGGAHCPPGFLSKAGTVELGSANGRWDVLDWSDTPSGLALRTRGGRISDVIAGTSFGRPPAVSGADAPQWVRYSAAQSSPGEINPLPAVDSFMALPGAIFEQRAVPLTWYTVGGAVRYRVQISTTAIFAGVIFDRQVESQGGRANEVVKVTTEPLAPGVYFWRVQALGVGAQAPFSASESFEIRDPAKTSPNSAAAPSGSPTTPASDEVVLPVPWIEQNKDTWLLALEADAEDPDPKPWDRPWRTQPPYCARASIAMVNAYYHAKLNRPGVLSQDRITYEVYNDRTLHDGPEVDIYVDAGFNAPMIADGLEFALGAPASRRFLVPVSAWAEYLNRGNTDGMFIWETVEDALKEGRPIVGTSECHAWVFAGYRRAEGQLELRVLDPAMGSYWFRPGEYRELTGGDDQPAGERLTETFFLPKIEEASPASDEPSIEPDSDNDGVRDFDEELRFKTGVHDDDSDDDGVRDKEEIRSSVFEAPQGWSIKTRNLRAGQFFPRPAETGRDFDGDGKMMELDPDSDNGGCKDGEEDLNANGIRDPGESSNFVRADDPVDETGACGALWTGTMKAIFQVRADGEDSEVSVRLRETRPYKLPFPRIPGMIEGIKLVDAGSVITRSYWTDRTESPDDFQTGHGTSGVLSPAGEILRAVEEVGPDGQVRWSDFYYIVTLRPSESLPYTWTRHSAYGTTVEVIEGGGQAALDTQPSGDQPISPHFKERYSPLGDGQMVGSYSNALHRVTWSICRQGIQCAPLPPLPPRVEPTTP